jgi:hypothetical protein
MAADDGGGVIMMAAVNGGATTVEAAAVEGGRRWVGRGCCAFVCGKKVLGSSCSAEGAISCLGRVTYVRSPMVPQVDKVICLENLRRQNHPIQCRVEINLEEP